MIMISNRKLWNYKRSLPVLLHYHRICIRKLRRL